MTRCPFIYLEYNFKRWPIVINCTFNNNNNTKNTYTSTSTRQMCLNKKHFKYISANHRYVARGSVFYFIFWQHCAIGLPRSRHKTTWLALRDAHVFAQNNCFSRHKHKYCPEVTLKIYTCFALTNLETQSWTALTGSDSFQPVYPWFITLAS